jgi:hypothetical protein
LISSDPVLIAGHSCELSAGSNQDPLRGRCSVRIRSGSPRSESGPNPRSGKQ